MAAPLGNQNATKTKPWEAALKRALARKLNGDLNHGLDKIADQVVALAIDKSDWLAIQEIANRLDGKAAQSVAVSGHISYELDMPAIDGYRARLSDSLRTTQ